MSDPWHDAALEVAYAWHRLESATTLPDQGDALVQLSNAMSDLKTWLPGWDGDTGTMPWERDEQDAS